MGFYDSLLDGDREQPGGRIHGVATGVVTANWDDKHPGMVKVELSLAEKGLNLTDWVRVAHPYAGKNYGAYLLPEVGDEVLLAFHMGDPDRPYVIGSLWNNVDTVPPGSAVEKNTVKRVRTKGGNEILMQEEKGKERIEIHTPGKLTITLEDEKKIISIRDGDGKNLMKVDSGKGEITIQAEKKITLDAGGSTLTLNGTAKTATLKADAISLEGGRALQGKGQSVKLEGGTAMELKAGATFKGQAGAMMELKGAMVKIN